MVENKPGANSNIAAGMVASAKPDGYSILFIANSNMAGSRYLFKSLPFDTVKDFTPAASFAEIAFVLTVSAKSPVKSVAELTAYFGGWMSQITRTEETRQFLERIAALPMYDDTKSANERLLADIEKWAPLVKAAKIEPQ